MRPKDSERAFIQKCFNCGGVFRKDTGRGMVARDYQGRITKKWHMIECRGCGLSVFTRHYPKQENYEVVEVTKKTLKRKERKN